MQRSGGPTDKLEQCHAVPKATTHFSALCLFGRHSRIGGFICQVLWKSHLKGSVYFSIRHARGLSHRPNSKMNRSLAVSRHSSPSEEKDWELV